MIHSFKRFFLLAVFALLMGQATLAGCSEDQPKVLGDVAAAAQAWEMIDAGALLIDVRSEKEFEGGSIEGALNIPHTEVDRLIEAIGEDKGRPVVFFCRSGGRAGRVQAQLEEMGYTGIFNGTGHTALEATRP
ncbi:MAG: rhodanese-like domain-containing protein [Xanthomonadales bacterium]|nr:rhodanese-like domain-containing protein [Xanthomonadales bacterium]NIX12027.1 rhodanese-like domain-containing protein [Xanthomonadales bacterium]